MTSWAFRPKKNRCSDWDVLSQLPLQTTNTTMRACNEAVFVQNVSYHVHSSCLSPDFRSRRGVTGREAGVPVTR